MTVDDERATRIIDIVRTMYIALVQSVRLEPPKVNNQLKWRKALHRMVNDHPLYIDERSLNLNPLPPPPKDSLSKK